MELNKIYNMDCLIGSENIESGSVDLILTDLPYGNMNTDGGRKININGWDLAIKPKRIYEIANRILRKNGKMILFSQEPYTTRLINDAIPNIPFNYRAIWKKDNFANALGVNKAMVGMYEDILIFSKSHPKHDFEGFHPLRKYFRDVIGFIGLNLKQINNALGHRRAEHTFYINSTQYGLCTEKTYIQLIEVFKINKMQTFKDFSELQEINKNYRTNLLEEMNKQYPSIFNLWQGNKYKSNILEYKKDYNGHHPTQKPILLLEDLVKTFSNNNNLVVDLTIGSGSTAIACINTNRNYIGFELDGNYCNIANERVRGMSDK